MDHFETSIRERAYALWERDGRTPGRDEHYWHLAEQELRPVSEAQAAEEIRAEAPAKPARKPAARKPAAAKAAATEAKPAPRRRRAAAAETVTTH